MNIVSRHFYNEVNTLSLLESFTNESVSLFYVKLSLYTRPMGEKGGLRMKDCMGCSVFFFAFLLSSSATASSRCLTSSVRINFNEFEYSLCPFSWPRAETASELCSSEIQIENACSADKCAWKSTEYCPFPLDIMDSAGIFSFFPCLRRKLKKHP